ncbi:MAG: hypothetical protein FJ218_02265 [Ignavibacteria bacterium]|nr:hypothetical protein [Ignavibacteria bacterium]
MEESQVVAHFKAYLRNEKWRVESKVTAGELFERWKFEPDVVAIKNKIMLVGEAKGSVDLHELFTGIGQCICNTQYGGNLVCLIVPYDIEQEARLLIRSCSLVGNGRIGLYVVKKTGDVIKAIECKAIKLNQRQRELGLSHLHKLTFIRDLRISELGRLLEKIYLLKNNFENKSSLYTIFSKSDKDYFFRQEVQWEI